MAQADKTRIFYVYALLRQDGLTPFYVGKGKGDRWLEHERNVKPGRSHKDNLIIKLLQEQGHVEKVKLAHCLTEEVALQMEVEMIRLIGRSAHGGPLLNLTDGGEGLSNPSDEVREKIAAATKAALTGRKRPPEVGAKVSAALTGIKRGPRSDEAKAKTSESLRKIWADPALSQGLRSAGMRGKKHSPETIERIRAAAKGRVISESQRQMVSARHKGRVQPPEEVERRRAAVLASYERKRTKENDHG